MSLDALSETRRAGAALLLVLFFACGCGRDEARVEREAANLLVRQLPQEALLLVEREWKAQPTSGRMAALVGRVRLAAGDYEGAGLAYQKACAIDRDFRRVRIADFLAIGQRWLENNSLEHAGDALFALSRLDPDAGRAIGSMLATQLLRANTLPALSLASLATECGPQARAAFAHGAGSARARVDYAVSPRARWLQTDVECSVGDTLRFSATGTVRAEAQREGWISEPCGPEGWRPAAMEWLEDRAGLPTANAPRMALLVRFGQGSVEPLGSGRELIVPASGRIDLAVNESPESASRGAGEFRVVLDTPVSALHPRATRQSSTREGNR